MENLKDNNINFNWGLLIVQLNQIFSQVPIGSLYKCIDHIRREIIHFDDINCDYSRQLSHYQIIRGNLIRARNYSIERGNGDHIITINFDQEQKSLPLNQWIELLINPTIEKINQKIISLNELSNLSKEIKL